MTCKLDLANCPFCATKLTNHVSLQQADKPIGSKSEGWYYVGCNMCGCRGAYCNDADKAVKKWNKAFAK